MIRLAKLYNYNCFLQCVVCIDLDHISYVKKGKIKVLFFEFAV